MKVPNDDEIDKRVKVLAEVLSARRQTMATAESCTGGWIAKVCTDQPGSSAWFNGGLVTYTNDLKQHLLGVPPDDLMQFGAVSEPVVRAMVDGACRWAKADWAVAVSGIAGPDGGTADKPVGTVWLSWGRGEQVIARCEYFSGNRDEIRRQAVVKALQGLIEQVSAVDANGP